MLHERSHGNHDSQLAYWQTRGNVNRATMAFETDLSCGARAHVCGVPWY